MAEVFNQPLGAGLAGIECGECGFRAAFTTLAEAEAMAYGHDNEDGDLTCPRCGDHVWFCDYIDEDAARAAQEVGK